ncbi:MAG TPA: hypothetical protein VFZ87_12905 [Gemmatimonadales bacterium]
MRIQSLRLATIARVAVALLVASAMAPPAAAQFGGLKKKLKPASRQEQAAPANGGAQGGMVVLTEEVVGSLVTGLKAGEAAREAAAQENTPYGTYRKAEAAYAAAKPKCEAAQQTFPQRMAGNEKMMNRYNALVEKMVAAQSKGDMKQMTIYQDSAMAMQDPSCAVKQPKQPEGYYEAEREINTRAEAAEIKASGLSASEYMMARERTEAILRQSAVPGDASPMEKSAVAAHSAELKPLLGMQTQPPAQATKTEAAPPPAAADPAPQVDPQMAAQASSMSDCMTKNAQSHQAEIQALGKRAQAAQAAGDNQKLMAIADTLQRIQMAGCQGR